MADGKWIEGLTPEMTTAEAARLVFLTRLAVVRTALPAAVDRASEDVEHIHQLRVGTRRAGAALKLLGDSLPSKVRQATKKSLRSLRRAAGEARDWDVFMLSLPDAKPLTTAAGKPTLDFLLGYALNERARAQQHLAEASKDVGATFEELCDRIPTSIDETGDFGAREFRECAREKMQALIRTFNAEVAANPTEAEALHQLRIQAKQVRYAMEIFSACFPPPFREVLYPAVEGLQEILGNLQDAVVGIQRLEGLRDSVQQVMPKEWPRLRTGINGLLTGLRRKPPVAKKQFQTWRTHWFRLSAEHPV